MKTWHDIRKTVSDDLTEEELLGVAVAAEKYNGAGRDTVLRLIAEVRHLRNLLENRADLKKEQVW
jgi:hypothetical protein